MEEILRAKIEEYLTGLDPNEFIQITNLLTNETGKQRIIDTIIDKMLASKMSIDDAVTEIEISLYN